MSLYGRRTCGKKNTSPLLSNRTVIPYSSFVPFPLPSAPPEEEPDEEPDDEGSQEEEKKQTLAVIPYLSGVSERIRKDYENFDLRVIFKSGPTLRSLLTGVKDPLPKEKPAGMVYQIPCQCGKVYAGETQMRLEMQVKEHRDACNKGDMRKSAI